MYVCLCGGITEAEVRCMAECHNGSMEAIKREIGLDDSCCGRCEAHLEELVAEALRPITH
jgi:bacterioferritin-associated ferredoxin